MKKRLTQKWIAMICSAAMLALLLAGCGGGGETAGSGSGNGGEKVSISIWHNWTGQDAKAVAMRKIIEDFRAQNPDIEVVDEGLPTDGLKTRLRTVAAADEMPDLFVMWPDAMTKEFVKGDLLQPIDDELNANPDWKNGFIPNALDGYTVDGKIYSVPMNLAPSSFIFYNDTLFKKYNVKVPETWEELEAAIQTFNDNGVIPIALGNKANWVAQSTFFSTVADRITGTDWFLKAVEQNGAKFTDPEFIEALKTFQKLGEINAFQEGFNSLDETQMMQLYFQGNAAMVVNGGWALANLVNNAPPEVLDNTHITIVPAIAGGKGDPATTSGVVGTGLGVSKKLDGGKKEAAMKLFYALAGPDGQKATLDSSTLVSYNIELDKSKAHPLFVELYDLVQGIKIVPVYDSKLGSATVEVVNNGLQELLMGGNPETIARKIQDTQAAVAAN
ncbi:MAG: extracellular solute-binding protein [Paenibacillus macerans]|uniref:Bacterial extracellular solute-binding family protein n=1 Tax=Paenibacillus macerans TaxID=44252 RepID=A0A090Z9P2_PAEMA|nr:extracellular solute-binding protein [Paenibacillus macerans]KFN07073.1 bacterial extracellular solute-binding family protein [Paenibacillus macerans]MBS5910581.1 extracellular solute-binding protein [Paenibacillus macerans]MCY7560612.1 extracellular solute-binding protein [Paenibacillus macerans]MDU7473674.1 extracellular solute-binding protein [Paenibacillus macerans]MEC0138536.1 extracellular solute-binding protein [Paenibacillus macerans]